MFVIFNELVPAIEKPKKSIPYVFHSFDNHTYTNSLVSLEYREIEQKYQ